MKVFLLDNQIDIILKSLENFIVINPEKRQLIYSTYESLLSQKLDKSSSVERNENVTLNLPKAVDKKWYKAYNHTNESKHFV